MKAMRLREFGAPLAWEEVAEPRPGPRQALVQSKANGLRATDLKVTDGLVPTVRTPLLLLGHMINGAFGLRR